MLHCSLSECKILRLGMPGVYILSVLISVCCTMFNVISAILCQGLNRFPRHDVLGTMKVAHDMPPNENA